MEKTTVYLPRTLKAALARVARARGCSEAQLIREALQAATRIATPPRPRLPLFHSKKARLAETVDESLKGFGGR
jgi:hypothetical protein